MPFLFDEFKLLYDRVDKTMLEVDLPRNYHIFSKNIGVNDNNPIRLRKRTKFHCKLSFSGKNLCKIQECSHMFFFHIFFKMVIVKAIITVITINFELFKVTIFINISH